MPIGYPGNSISKAARAKAGGGFESAISTIVSGALTDNGDGTITVTGSGFGASGPEFAFNLDAANVPDGQNLSAANAVIGSGTVVTSGELAITSNAKMLGGKGIVIGANGTDLGSTSYARLRITHPAVSRVFESRTSYFREAASKRAVDYFSGALADPHPGGSNPNQDWQVKPVWNQADEDFGANDTDFFVKIFETRAANGFRDDAIISTNSVGTKYLVPPLSRITRQSYNGEKIPLDEPYTTEFGWDQGSLDSTTDGTFFVNIYSSVFGVHTSGEFTGQELVVPSGDFRQINSLTYPGYILGYNIDNDTNLIDQQIYRQIGPHAYARIAICDTADYFAAKRRIFLPPTGVWSDTSITPELPKWASGLSDFSGMYVCVVGSDNVQVGTGELI